MIGDSGVVHNNKCDIIVRYVQSYGMSTNNCVELSVVPDGLICL